MTPPNQTVHPSHHMQLFDSAQSRVDAAAEFLRSGFERGETLLIVATPEHTELLGQHLESCGIDIRSDALKERVVFVDAAQLMANFMRRERPDALEFEGAIGSLLMRMAHGARACIYGEMVDLLAASGNYKAALELEELWNELGRRLPFTLFCGYSSGHFGDPRTAPSLASICAAHGHLHCNRDDMLAGFLLDQAGARGGDAPSQQS